MSPSTPPARLLLLLLSLFLVSEPARPERIETAAHRWKQADFYDDLSLPADCSSGDIHRRFRAITAEASKGAGAPSGNRNLPRSPRFLKAAAAYHVLKDAKLRRRYDDFKAGILSRTPDDDVEGGGGGLSGLGLPAPEGGVREVLPQRHSAWTVLLALYVVGITCVSLLQMRRGATWRQVAALNWPLVVYGMVRGTVVHHTEEKARQEEDERAAAMDDVARAAFEAERTLREAGKKEKRQKEGAARKAAEDAFAKTAAEHSDRRDWLNRAGAEELEAVAIHFGPATTIGAAAKKGSKLNIMKLLKTDESGACSGVGSGCMSGVGSARRVCRVCEVSRGVYVRIVYARARACVRVCAKRDEVGAGSVCVGGGGGGG
jgi:hypothetical protein